MPSFRVSREGTLQAFPIMIKEQLQFISIAQSLKETLRGRQLFLRKTKPMPQKSLRRRVSREGTLQVFPNHDSGTVAIYLIAESLKETLRGSQLF